MKHVLLRAGLVLAAACLAPLPVLAQSDLLDVSLRFAGEVNGAPFACGESYDGVGAPPATITPTDFRFYVIGVELIDRAGKATSLAVSERAPWQADGITLIDFEDGSGPCAGGNGGLNDRVEGKVPAGDYVGLRFTLGLPFMAAHGDVTVASAPLDISAMFWSWQTGYRYLKVDMTGDMSGGHGGRPTGFSIHLGDSGCVGPSFSQRPSGCTYVNVVPVALEQFDIAGNVVVADLGRLLADTDTGFNTPDTAPGCMSEVHDPDCIGVFAGLGLPFGGDAGGPQTFFASR